MIAENLKQVQARIQNAANRAGRDPGEITLVGVTKQQPVETLLAGYQAGLQHFGENRVEEIVEKIPALLTKTSPDRPPIIHMIGHLQRRKVASILPYVHLIHSVDTVKLAERIDRLADKPMDILLECNTSGEASKAGFAVKDWSTDPAVLDRFLADIQTVIALERVQIKGLMTMAPFVDNAEETRPTFHSLRLLLAACQARFPEQDWRHLSMGMTNDFEVAIEEGATLVRVGRAIFPRNS